MDDWDKRVEEVAETYATGNHSVSFADTADAKAFIAGANWAREEISKDNFLAMMSTGLYEAENEIEALRKQCEAMAKGLEECLADIEDAHGNDSYSCPPPSPGAVKALASYRKFMEGFDE